jgi:hypothetical protein
MYRNCGSRWSLRPGASSAALPSCRAGYRACSFTATALLGSCCMAGAARYSGLFTGGAESVLAEVAHHDVALRTLQQVEPAIDALNPKCFWAGKDCRADLDALFPEHSLYLDVISHRGNASVCLSWTTESVGDCRTGAASPTVILKFPMALFVQWPLCWSLWGASFPSIVPRTNFSRVMVPRPGLKMSY